MDPTIAFAVGGLVGAALRVFITNDQTTFSKRSVIDVVLGGVVGLLFPLYPVIELPAAASLLQKAALIALVAYTSSDLLGGVLGRLIKQNGTTAPPK